MLKAAIKQSPADQVRHRVIPQDAITKCAERLEELRDEVAEVLKEEKEEKAVSLLVVIRGKLLAHLLHFRCGKARWSCARVKT